MFHLANRGKRSIVIDLSIPAGLDVLRRLSARVDVVAENFRPGVAERMGVGYSDLREANANLIYLSIAGFGSDGPLASTKVYDNLIQAVSGIAAQQADDDGTPRLVQSLICDKITALVAAQAITAALLARERGSGGQHIELSMLDAAVAFLWSDAGTEHTFTGEGVERSRSGAGNDLTPHADGWSTAAPVTDDEFRAFCRAYGRSDLAEDPALATMSQRLADPRRYRAAREQLHEAAATLTTETATRRLRAAGVPAVEAVPVAQVPNHPQVIANGTFVATNHPVAGPLIEPRPPARFAGKRLAPASPAPVMGEHTDEILRQAGFDDTEILSLRDSRAVS